MAKTLLETVTRDGEIPLYNRKLNDAKLEAADRILEGVQKNDNRAILEFKEHLGARRGESIHTTGDDFVHAFAQLNALAVRDEYEAAERTWSDAIETEPVTSFETPIDYSITAVTEGFARPGTEPGKPDFVPPLVPEGSPYPHFRFQGERSASGRIHKRGGRYDLTFEEIIRDVATLVPRIPTLLNDALLDAEEFDAWYGLIEFINIPANHLQGGETLIGQQVTTDSVLSYQALDLALDQAQNREIRGKKVSVRSYNLVVPTGKGRAALRLINTLDPSLLARQTGLDTLSYNLSGYNPLSGIAGVVESDYMTGNQWALIPAKGAVRGPNKFYKLGQLVGHVGPELRLENVTGQYLGGSTVGPFEGDFETDSAAFRGRIIQGGLGWNPEYAVWSDGTGALV